jgi:predicted dehydrogenase/nucleoside-diphosphate-sugar epimerase
MTTCAIRKVSRNSSGPTAALRLALVGCGAIAEQFHLPVLAGLEGITLAALVDRDERRAGKLAQAYGVKSVLRDVDDLSADDFDAAIIATPPFHHAPATISLLRRGLHVLVEKPMALNLAEAEEMCRTADETGRVLAVGLYKRLLPVTKLLRRLVHPHPGPLPRGEGEGGGGQWGRPLSFTYEWGGMGGYASATLGLMRKDYAGGGVLMDLGAHAFDQLVAIFGDAGEVRSYRDDARGGIEADCMAELAFETASGPVRGTVALSRVRNLDSRLEIRCERATLSAALNERFEVTVRPVDGDPLVMRAAGPTDVSWYESYRAEIDDFLVAIQSGDEPELSGRSVLPSVGLIEDCYSQREPQSVPWLDDMPRASVPAGTNGRRRKVLVTGAGGFIGSRVAEILSLRDGHDVRAMVRGAASASRLARLPIEMVLADLKSDADVRRAIEGCDTVVHCAVGTAYGQPREIEAVTVGGTQRLAAAARAAGVGRFVHLSSIGVHDAAWSGKIDGNTPVRPRRGDWYGQTKARAEAAVRAEESRGLSVAVLRPGCVFGPFGFTFVINPLRALAAGRLVLENSADSPANTVFVDNLVEAIACSLVAPEAAVRGRAFAIGDGDDCTWGEYYGWYAERLGTELVERSGLPASAAARRPGLLRRMAEPLVSAEAKSFAKRLLASDPIGTLPRWVLGRFPAVESKVRDLAGMNTPVIYHRAGSGGVGEPIVITPRAASISIVDAREHLGFAPPVARETAQELTWRWAEHARIV